MEEAAPQVTKFETGEQVGDFTLPKLHGGTPLSLRQVLSRSQQVALLLLSCTCSTCEAIVQQVAELERRPASLKSIGWTVVLVWHGEVSDIVEKTRVLPVSEEIVLLVDEKASLARDYLISAMPIGLALDHAGKVLDQSQNPGPSWLYRTLNVPAPEHDLLPTSWVGEIQTRG
jgi:hypothetical protein